MDTADHMDLLRVQAIHIVPSLPTTAIIGTIHRPITLNLMFLHIQKLNFGIVHYCFENID